MQGHPHPQIIMKGSEMTFEIAPEIEASQWLNCDTPLRLSGLRGKVVLIEAFQMLCPGCVSHSLPQAMKADRFFNSDDVAVIGLHTVFEHHAAQGSKAALSAFLHEYRITFPVAIDAASPSGNIPKTMAKYQMRGTPTLILIDRSGRLRRQFFGQIEDMILGAEIMTLVNEAKTGLSAGAQSAQGSETHTETECDDTGCRLP